MNTIYKYPLEIVSGQAIELPFGAEILDAQIQNDQLCIWALIDMDIEAPAVTRHFVIYGTGKRVALPGAYIATVQHNHFVLKIL